MRSSAGYEKKPRCDPVKVLLTNILVCVIFGFRLRVFEIKSSMNRVLLWSLSIEGNTNAYNFFVVAIFIVCTFLHTQKEIHWTSISVFVFVFALKSIFSSKNISLHYWTLTSIVRNKVTVFGHFLVYQKQLWLHKHWSIGTVHIYFSTFVRFLRLTIILLLILKEEKKNGMYYENGKICLLNQTKIVSMDVIVQQSRCNEKKPEACKK